MEMNGSDVKLESSLFESDTKAIVWGQQNKAVQVNI